MYLAACLIIRDEAEYVEEWIDFHISVGFNHIIIYDDESNDNLKEILNPYIDKNIVTYIYWDGEFVKNNQQFFYELNNEGKKNKQISAYLHAIKSFKDFVWIAFIDSDEFLFSPTKKDLKEILKDYEDYSSIAAYWKVFGTSNLINKSSEPVLKKFIQRPKDSFHLNTRFKSIVQPKYTTHVQTAHRFRTKSYPIIAYDENKKPLLFEGWGKMKPSTNILRINHYYTKSKEEWDKKINRGWLDIGKSRVPFRISVVNEIDKNTIEDKLILKILNQ